MLENEIDFGYWPCNEIIRTDSVYISPLPTFNSSIMSINNNPGLLRGWIYPPYQQSYNIISSERTILPYPSRIFGLPKTHKMKHYKPDSVEHLEFLIWGLSFFTGLRLTTTEAGFVDAAPIKLGSLTDFIQVSPKKNSMCLLEIYWLKNKARVENIDLIRAIIHALYLYQRPQLLQYERFIYGYVALDACYALAKQNSPPAKDPKHAERFSWLCQKFEINTPTWAQPAPKDGSRISSIRNATLHEAIYMGKPLGYAIQDNITGENMLLEMGGLICRFLIALLGRPESEYVKSPIGSRQIYPLNI